MRKSLRPSPFFLYLQLRASHFQYTAVYPWRACIAMTRGARDGHDSHHLRPRTKVAEPVLVEPHNYLRKRADPVWVDTRYRLGPGDKVRILEDPHQGRIATVTTLGAQMRADWVLVSVACYNTTVEHDGRWVTVRWDAMELVDHTAIDITGEEEHLESLGR